MSFSIFPKLIGETVPVVRRPIFSTIIQGSSAGVEVRIGEYLYPIREWDIPYSYLSAEALVADQQTLEGFVIGMTGMFSAFLYDDANDNSTTLPDAPTPTPSIIGTGDATTTTFQLGRTLSGRYEPLYDVNATVSAPKIYLGSTLQTSGYTISATGLITFSSAPGSGVQVKADFQYYWRVRFAADSFDFENFAGRWWEAKSIKLRQVKAV